MGSFGQNPRENLVYEAYSHFLAGRFRYLARPFYLVETEWEGRGLNRAVFKVPLVGALLLTYHASQYPEKKQLVPPMHWNLPFHGVYNLIKESAEGLRKIIPIDRMVRSLLWEMAHCRVMGEPTTKEEDENWLDEQILLLYRPEANPTQLRHTYAQIFGQDQLRDELIAQRPFWSQTLLLVSSLPSLTPLQKAEHLLSTLLYDGFYPSTRFATPLYKEKDC